MPSSHNCRRNARIASRHACIASRHACVASRGVFDYHSHAARWLDARWPDAAL
jgi:hypothetical protein